jgi:hypothetical protein
MQLKKSEPSICCPNNQLMKNQKILLSVFSLLCILTFSGFNKDQCNSEQIYQDALEKLNGFSFLKDYRVYLKKKKKDGPVEVAFYPLTMNRGEKYRFFGLQSAEYKGRIEINIYADATHQNLIATTYNPSTQTSHESIEFLSHSTGNFCIGFYFLNGDEGCGVGMSSFKKE